MRGIRSIRDVAKIGKKFFKELIEPIMNHDYLEVEDFTSCDCDCRLLAERNKSPENFNSSLCNEYCRKHISIKEVSKGEDNNLISKTHIFLSKLQILQLLLYHFWAYGEHGLIPNLTDREIADILKCNIKTVQNNNKRFTDLNLIFMSHKLDHRSYSILLKNYSSYHEKGGQGYLILSKDSFLTLLDEVDSKKLDTNHLRNSLRMLLINDNDTVSKKQNSVLTFTEIREKRYLPPHINYPGAIKRIVENHSKIFESMITDKEVRFRLKDEFKGKLVREENRLDYLERFRERLKLITLVNEEKLYSDLSQMSVEYGFEKVNLTLDAIEKEYGDLTIIDNLAGLVRRIAKTSSMKMA